MSIPTDTVATFRSQWATRFVDTVNVVRLAEASDRGSIDSSTLLYPSETLTEIYTNRPALIRPISGDAAPSRSDFGQQDVTYTDYGVFFSYDTVGLEIEDRIIPQTSERGEELVGLALRIASIEYDSYRTRLFTVCTLDLGAGEQG